MHNINKLLVLIGFFVVFGSQQAVAIDVNECPVDSVNIEGLNLDDEFGDGTSEITRCLKRRHNVKLLIQANKYCGKNKSDGTCGRPYALHNIQNVIKDYEITSGMIQGQDYKIAVVVHSSGGMLLLDPDIALADGGHPKAAGNQFATSHVKDLMSKGVKFYFCQNTARGMKVTTEQLIPGVQYVTAGISALADFQSEGWTYVQP